MINLLLFRQNFAKLGQKSSKTRIKVEALPYNNNNYNNSDNNNNNDINDNDKFKNNNNNFNSCIEGFGLSWLFL